MLEECDFPTVTTVTDELERLPSGDVQAIARLITLCEYRAEADNKEAAAAAEAAIEQVKALEKRVPVLGITGTGGAGKSSLTDELVRRFLNEIPDIKIAILSVDPTKQKTGGALLGDRIRMNSINSPRVYMRSLATRHSRTELSPAIRDAISVVKAAGFDLVIIETSGIGQGDAAITEVCDVSMYVMTSEFGAPTQLEKIDMIDYADLIVINKFERKGSEDAKRQVQKQYQRSHQLFDRDVSEMPVYGTIASQFNDPGTNTLFVALVDTINQKQERIGKQA
ncbi:putative GTPase [Geobacillus sp. BCO2]|nr:putative GTPase [Geobacillus sp. BCO2]